MPRAERRRVWVKGLTAKEKAEIAEACGDFIAQRLKPRFLRESRPTEFNYPVDILGKWRGSKYSFTTRYRSGFPGNLGEEFDAPFARLDHVEEQLGDTLFDVMWRRHNDRWWRLHSSVTLNKALQLIESDELLWPI